MPRLTVLAGGLTHRQSSWAQPDRPGQCPQRNIQGDVLDSLASVLADTVDAECSAKASAAANLTIECTVTAIDKQLGLDHRDARRQHQHPRPGDHHRRRGHHQSRSRTARLPCQPGQPRPSLIPPSSWATRGAISFDSETDHHRAQAPQLLANSDANGTYNGR